MGTADLDDANRGHLVRFLARSFDDGEHLAFAHAIVRSETDESILLFDEDDPSLDDPLPKADPKRIRPLLLSLAGEPMRRKAWNALQQIVSKSTGRLQARLADHRSGELVASKPERV